MQDASVGRPDFAQALAYWFKLGCLSFGGPAGQIAMMQHDLVDKRAWIGQRSFLRGLSFATLLPGPEAQQLATYIGWRLHGTWGGIAAGTLFVVPGALCMLLLSYVAAVHGDAGIVGALFDGLKPVVVAVVLHAVWRIGKKALLTWQAAALAAAAFAAIHFAGIGFPWVVAAAALAGVLSVQGGPPSPFAAAGHAAPGIGESDVAQTLPANPIARFLKLSALFALLWAVPVGLVLQTMGLQPFFDVATLFTKAAFVTFGGAYAVLPYVADAAVNVYAWLTPDDMLNGLALAETTPGPLILVLQYVGFFAGWNGATSDPLMAATVAALLASYVTFLPSFLFILAGAPYVEGLHENKAASAALGAITAAVVGVILNLGVFLGQAVFLPATGIDWVAIGVAAAAFWLLVRVGLAIHWLVIAGAAFGAARYLVGL
jgi:chromate transporter